jgi:uroporphyrinogen-III synthase
MRRLPVFAVGDATAQAAREAGFNDVASASGDVAALAVLIAGRKDALTGQVLYLAPEEPAGDLVGALRTQGVPARSEVVYRTVPAALATPPADIDIVLIHSPKAARRLAEDPVLAASVTGVTAICISARAAEPLHGLGLPDVLIASAPSEAALLELFQACAAGQPRPRLFTPVFWAVIGFGLACIVAAVLVAGLGPRLMGLRVDRPATPTVQPLQIHKNSG